MLTWTRVFVWITLLRSFKFRTLQILNKIKQKFANSILIYNFHLMLISVYSLRVKSTVKVKTLYYSHNIVVILYFLTNFCLHCQFCMYEYTNNYICLTSFFEMGANKSQLTSTRPFDKEQWQPVPLIPYTNIKDPLYASNFRVLANKLNSTLQVQKYDLYFTNYKEYCSYKEIINWRNSNRFTVQVKYVSEPQRQNICATYYQGSIYIERIPIRLVQIEDISIEEGLYILNAASQGFQKLYQKFNYFQIEPEMICFTKEGYVKVWVNKNLSKYQPQTIFNENRSENYDYFLQKLVSIVEKLIDFEGKITIRNFIQLHQIVKPYENFLKILEQYAKYTKIKVPRYLNTIRNLCDKDTKIKNLYSRRRNSLASYQLGSTSRNIAKPTNNKSLQIDQEVVNISIKNNASNKNDIYIQSIDLSRKQNYNDPKKTSHVTPRALTVRFSYLNNNVLSSIPSNSAMQKQEETFSKTGPQHSQTGSQIVSPNQSNDFMEQRRPRYLSVFQNQDIDPDIAEDIRRYTRY